MNSNRNYIEAKLLYYIKNTDVASLSLFLEPLF